MAPGILPWVLLLLLQIYPIFCLCGTGSVFGIRIPKVAKYRYGSKLDPDSQHLFEPLSTVWCATAKLPHYEKAPNRNFYSTVKWGGGGFLWILNREMVSHCIRAEKRRRGRFSLTFPQFTIFEKSSPWSPHTFFVELLIL